MLTTHFPPGSPCWIDLGSPDLEATAAFYGDLFAWRFQPVMDGYGFWQVDGKTVAAAGVLMDEGPNPGWIVYFHAPDCDATAKAVEAEGGTVRAQPCDIEGHGRMAQFTDPAGAEFAAWQPGGTHGLDLVNDPGSLGWVELHTPDPEAARGFYGSVFGWEFEDMDMDGRPYPVASPAGGGQDATMAGLWRLEPGAEPRWVPYFEVPDCDATVARCRELGGAVQGSVQDIPEVGRAAFLSDPHGAGFAVITSVT